MKQVEVILTGLAITSRYGTLKSGDRLTTDADYAEHLVKDCRAAEYAQPAAQEPAADEPRATRPRKK